jgi:hypothetical protein
MATKNPRTRRIVLRGYVKDTENGRHVAVCLTLNLVVEGRSRREALTRLHNLIRAYLQDAVSEGELEQWVPRRAPLYFYVEYVLGRIVNSVLALRPSVHTFKDDHLIAAHA